MSTEGSQQRPQATLTFTSILGNVPGQFPGIIAVVNDACEHAVAFIIIRVKLLRLKEKKSALGAVASVRNITNSSAISEPSSVLSLIRGPS